MRKYNRLPLIGTYNTRELGGYPTENSNMTRHNVFLRSDNLANLTYEDKSFLYNYGIRTILDLRGSDEIINIENHIMNDSRFEYKNIPLIDSYEGFDNLYIMIADVFSSKVSEAFHFIAERIKHGGILFHCMVGKDRTGVISALLLSLAGVQQADITANYMVSSIYLRSLFEKYLTKNPDIPLDAMESKPAMIEGFMKHINTKYNGTYDYLKSIGITEVEINDILTKFVD